MAEEAIELGLAMAANLGVSAWFVQVVTKAATDEVQRLVRAGEPVSESVYLRGVMDRLEAGAVNVGWEIVHDEDPVTGVVCSEARAWGWWSEVRSR